MCFDNQKWVDVIQDFWQSGPSVLFDTLKGWSRTRLSKMFELVAEVSPQKSHQDAFSCRSMLKLWYATYLNSSWREIPMEEWRETCKYSAPIQVKCLS